MATVDLTVTLRKRWFYPLAMAVFQLGVRLGLIRGEDALERAAKWLTAYAMVFKVR